MKNSLVTLGVLSFIMGIVGTLAADSITGALFFMTGCICYGAVTIVEAIEKLK